MRIIKRIKNSLIYQLIKAKKRNKTLEKKLVDEIVEKQKIIDEIEPLRIKIRELDLKVKEYELCE